MTIVDEKGKPIKDGSLEAGMLALELLGPEVWSAYTWQEIAWICGVHRSTFWNYEKRLIANGRAICEARGISTVDDLIPRAEVVDLS